MLSTAILVNRAIGTPLSDEPSFLQVNYLKLNTYEEALDYLNYFESGVPIYSAEEINDELIKFNDSSINEDTYKQIIEDFSIKAIVERRGPLD